MKFNQKSAAVLAFLSLLGFLAAIVSAPKKQAAAAPAPLELYVHHGHKQCGVFFMGDEFKVCDPAAGWVQAADGKCPAGYVDTQKRIPRENCQRTEWADQHLSGREQPHPPSGQQGPPPPDPRGMERIPPPPPPAAPTREKKTGGFGCSAPPAFLKQNRQP